MAYSENSKAVGTVQGINALIKSKSSYGLEGKVKKKSSSRTPVVRVRTIYRMLDVNILHIIESSLRDALRPWIIKSVVEPTFPSSRTMTLEVLTPALAILTIYSTKEFFGPQLTLFICVILALVEGYFIHSVRKEITDYHRKKVDWELSSIKGKDSLDACLEAIKEGNDKN